MALADDDKDDEDDENIPFYQTIGVTGTEVFVFENNETFDYDKFEGYTNNVNVIMSKDIYSFGLAFRYEYYTEELGERKNRNRLHKKFFELSTSSLALTLGDFYTTFGKGLLVSVIKDDLVNVDTSVEGARVILEKGPVNAQFMGGRIYELEADLTHMIGGAELTTELPHQVTIGSGFVYFMEDTDLVTHEKCFLVGPSLSINSIYNMVDFYAEYVYYDRELASSSITGHGFYTSATFYYRTWTLLAEYKDYYKFAFLYNLAPTLDREDEPTGQDDERGSRIKITYNLPGSPDNFYVSRVDFTARDSDSFTVHTYAGAQFFDLWDRTYVEIYTGIRETYEKIFKFFVDSSTRITDKNSLQLTYKRTATHLAGTPNNYEDDVFLGFSRSPWLTATVMWQYSDQKILGNTSLWGFECEVKPKDYFSLKIFVGSQKGGLVCSGGVCRVVDPFEGIQIRAEYRF